MSSLVITLLTLAVTGSAGPAAVTSKNHAAVAPPRQTVVSIKGTRFYLNGRVTYPGTRVQGLLLNSRMVQAVFDDENPDTVGKWAYPDTGRWDPQRNTREFVAAIPTYARYGLRAITFDLQGGSPDIDAPGFHGDNQQSVVTAYRPDGSVKSAWLARADRVIRACDRNGIVVILGFFYFGQDHRLTDEQAVITAVDNVTDWLLRRRFTNVLIEINNESDVGYNHEVLQPERIVELIRRVQTRSGGRLKVSTSFSGGYVPQEPILRKADFVAVHGNGQGPEEIRAMIDRIRSSSAYRAHPKPIIFDEDSTSLANMDAAIGRRASWGYYDQGDNNYVDGFQSPPVNWSVNTPGKLDFFRHVAALARKRGAAAR